VRDRPRRRIERLRPEMPGAFEGLLRIYREAIPQSERKTDEALAGMLAQSDYEFSLALAGDVVTAFSIVKPFVPPDSCLLEYMAVDGSLRGRGIGSALFQAACASAMTATRFVLLEVDSEAQPSADRAIRARRKLFYRTLGCREVAGLSYLMPSVSLEEPPRMNLLVYRRELPDAIDKATLRRWLQCIYVQVYRQQADDPRIDRMLSALTDPAALR